MKKFITFFSILGLIGSLAAEDIALTPEQQEYFNQIICDSKDQSNSSISNIIAVTKENYAKEILESSQPVFVLVSAHWCPPCQLFKPIFNSVAGDFKHAFKFVNIDFDSFSEFVTEQQIDAIPMLVLFHKGQVLGICPGFMTKADFRSCLVSIQQSLKVENK